jgi:hypothetical protein
MSATSLPAQPFTTSQPKADHLSWTAGQPFSAYGLRFELCVNDRARHGADSAGVARAARVARTLAVQKGHVARGMSQEAIYDCDL